MKLSYSFTLVAVVICALAGSAVAGVPFVYKDGLAPRDEWGRLHQMPQLDRTDWEPRYAVRFHYYLKGAATLQRDPAYVGAVQRDLRRLGYYCGEIDGIFTPEVSDAVARLQKHYGFKVTGTINVAVRRALRLP
jgi:murein L,D-transpeptidase YcbB/YkuD